MHKSGIIRASFCFLLCIVFSVATIFVCDNYKASLPLIMEIHSNLGVGAFADNSYLQNVPNLGFAASSPAQMEIESDNININAVYTNGGYGELARLKITSGNYFTANSVHKGERLCVIDSEIESKHFRNIAAIGSFVAINGEKYKIAGVYSLGNNFLDKLSSRAISNIYISTPCPDTALPSLAINQILLNSSENQSLGASINALQNAAGFYITGTVRDYATHIGLAAAFVAIGILLAAMYPITKLFGIGIRNMADLLGKEYLKKSGFLADLAAALAPFLAGLALFAVCFANIKIPAAFLTSDNIFDISAYLTQILSFFRNVYSGGFSSLCLYSANYLPVIALLCVISAGFFVLGCVFSHIIKKKR